MMAVARGLPDWSTGVMETPYGKGTWGIAGDPAVAEVRGFNLKVEAGFAGSG
jgi:hypothetical protein